MNVLGASVPSVPTIVAVLCCSWRFFPNCCALGGSCHGSTTTVVCGVTFATSEEKSVTFWLTDSWSTLIPAFLNTGIIEDTRPVEYTSWSSTIMTALGCSLLMMKFASSGP